MDAIMTPKYTHQAVFESDKQNHTSYRIVYCLNDFSIISTPLWRPGHYFWVMKAVITHNISMAQVFVQDRRNTEERCRHSCQRQAGRRNTRWNDLPMDIKCHVGTVITTDTIHQYSNTSALLSKIFHDSIGNLQIPTDTTHKHVYMSITAYFG